MDQFWDNLQELFSATGEPDLEKSLNKILSIGKDLSKAEILALFLANDQDPGFQRYGCVGPHNLLPENLPAQDLIHLSKPQQWILGKRLNTALHNAARTSKLQYLASSPIGQSNAIIGLMVIADSNSPPTDYTLQITKLLAISITSVIQDYFKNLQQKADNELNRHHQRINSIIEEQIHEGLILLDRDLKIKKLNLSSEMMLGYANQEVLGRNVTDILISTEPLLPSLKDAQRGNANFNLGDLRLYRRNGDTFLAHVRTLPVINENEIEGVIILITDLSEYDQLNSHALELEKRAFLGEITSIFAHEVRNPINNISTGLQLMAYDLPNDDPNYDSLERLQRECERLEELMKSVLSFSRSSEFEMEPINLPSLLQHLLQRLKSRLSRYNVEANLQAISDCPPILGNPRALEQVFTNLINNANQAMQETGGKISIKIQTIKTAENSQFVETSVADTGPGIPIELQEKIFKPYFTTEKSGTGLGLAIASKIIEAHNGTIDLESFPGASVFHIRFPIAIKQDYDSKNNILYNKKITN